MVDDWSGGWTFFKRPWITGRRLALSSILAWGPQASHEDQKWLAPMYINRFSSAWSINIDIFDDSVHMKLFNLLYQGLILLQHFKSNTFIEGKALRRTCGSLVACNLETGCLILGLLTFPQLDLEFHCTWNLLKIVSRLILFHHFSHTHMCPVQCPLTCT